MIETDVETERKVQSGGETGMIVLKGGDVERVVPGDKMLETRTLMIILGSRKKRRMGKFKSNLFLLLVKIVFPGANIHARHRTFDRYLW